MLHFILAFYNLLISVQSISNTQIPIRHRQQDPQQDLAESLQSLPSLKASLDDLIRLNSPTVSERLLLSAIKALSLTIFDDRWYHHQA